MSASPDVTNGIALSARAPRRWFYAAAVLFMLLGVAVAFVQKGRESSAALAVAKRIASGVQETVEHNIAVKQILRDAELWQSLSLAAVFLAFILWGVAVLRCEKPRGTWAILASLFALYVGLQLIMV